MVSVDYWFIIFYTIPYYKQVGKNIIDWNE